MALTERNRRLLTWAPWLVVGLVIASLWWWQVRAPEPAQLVQCPDLHAGCTVQVDGRTITVRVAGDLQVLKPFRLTVQAAGARKVQASFTMAGMDMGFNLYSLQADADGLFQARVVLPVCVSGRRDWRMMLEIDNMRIELPFVTELS